MELFIYLIYRGFTAGVGALPLRAAYRLGQALGGAAYLGLAPYRRLALRNLTIAYGGERPAREIRRLARAHFRALGANLLSSIKAASLSVERLREIASVENIESLAGALDRGRGVVLVISHIGNWELFAQICQFLPGRQWSTVYQPLGNRRIEAHVQRTRMARGVRLFSRKNGFNAPTAFLRAGGAVGVLVDQHAGDGGVWAPFFGRLASTSTLAALLALRTDAELVPIAIQTAAPGRWRVVVSEPIPRAPGEGVNALTARVNLVLERQIRASPADWFWVHNRWKTPRPKFLLTAYRRGVTLPASVSASDLKPFRLIVRSPNWLGDAVMTIPAVQAMARGRPDARVTILSPERLADLWRIVPGVAEVVTFAGKSAVAAAAAVRQAGPFDAAVVLPSSLRAALEMRLAGVPRRVGYAGHRRRWLLTEIVDEPKPGARELSHGERPHQSRRYAHLAQAIGAGEIPAEGQSPEPAATVDQIPDLILPTAGQIRDLVPPAVDPIRDLVPVERAAPAPDHGSGLQAEPDRGSGLQLPARGAWLTIGLCPGAEYGPAKRWLPERFAETARRVSEARACRWVLLGTAKDRAAGDPIAAELGDHCENLLGQTTLAELITTLRGCDALLTNDTGAMHLAAWLGVPTVAVFGSTDPDLTSPLAAPGRVRILRHQVECSPCFLRKCPIDLRCMKAVTADEAVEAVLAMIR